MAVCGRAAIAKERLVHLLAIDCEWSVLRAVSPQATTVFVYVLVVRWLVHVPDPAIAVGLCVQGNRLNSTAPWSNTQTCRDDHNEIVKNTRPSIGVLHDDTSILSDSER